MLMGFVVVIIGITFYQEQKTERALEALRDLSSRERWSSGWQTTTHRRARSGT